MPMTESEMDVLVQQLKKKLNLNKFTGKMGDSDNLETAVVDEPGRPGLVRVRVDNADTPYSVVKSGLLGAYSPYAGSPVVLGFDEKGDLAIEKADHDAIVQVNGNPLVLNSGDNRVTAVGQTDSLLPLFSGAVSANAGTLTNEIFINPWRFTDGTTARYFQGAKIDLTAQVPGANLHRYVAIFLNMEDLTIEVSASTPKATITPLTEVDKQECISARLPKRLPTWLWKLSNSQTVVTNTDKIEDLRPWLSPTDISSGVLYVDGLQFNTNPSGLLGTEGETFYDSADHTLTIVDGANSSIQVGQEGRLPFSLGYNDNVGTIDNGTAVFISDNGAQLTIDLACSEDPDITERTVGIATESIAPATTGRVATFGFVRGLDTQTPGWALGDTLYVSPTTPGELTNVRPTGGNFPIRIAIVDTVDLTDGVLFIPYIDIRDPNDIKSATGFPLQATPLNTISFVDGTRTFTITPNGSTFYMWQLGQKYIITGADDLIISADEGKHYIYYDEGVLTEVLDPVPGTVSDLIRNKVLVAVIYWDATNSEEIYFGNERHGANMSNDTHAWAHFAFGTQYLFGLDITDILADQSGALDSHAQFGSSLGVITDEDLINQIATITSTTGLPIYYLSTANLYARRLYESGFSVLTDVTAGTGATGRLVWNDTSTGVLTTVGNGNHVLCHIFATNKTDEKNIALVGQAEYATKAAARAGAETEIRSIIAQFPAEEIVAIATVIFETKNTFSNAVLARTITTDTGDDYIDWRQTPLSGGGSGSGTATALTLDADSGTPQAITDGDTMSFLTGPHMDSVVSATDTVTHTIKDDYVLNTGDDMTGNGELLNFLQVAGSDMWVRWRHANVGDYGMRIRVENSTADVHMDSINGGVITSSLLRFDVSEAEVVATSLVGNDAMTVRSTSALAMRGLNVEQASTNASGAIINFTKSRGTHAAPTTVVDGDFSGVFANMVYDGTSFLQTAGFGFKTTGAVSTGVAPTSLFFVTGSINDTVGANTRLIIDENGNVLVNGFTASTVGLTVKTAISQTANAFEVVNPSDEIGVAVSPDTKELRWYDIGASNYVGFKAPALTANQVWALPIADGTANQALKTDGSGNLGWVTVVGAAVVPQIPQARISLSTLLSVPTSTTLVSTEINYVRHGGGDKITVYDGANWIELTIPSGGINIDNTGLSFDTNYEVYVYDSSGATLELEAWAGDTTQPAKSLQDGWQTKSGDATRFWVGTVRTFNLGGSVAFADVGTGGGSTASPAMRFVSNRYNRVPRSIDILDDTDSVTTSSTAIEAWLTDSNNSVSIVNCIDQEPVSLHFSAGASSAGTAFTFFNIGLSPTVKDAKSKAALSAGSALATSGTVVWENTVGIGARSIYLLQSNSAAVVNTIFGDSGFAALQFGASGHIWG